MSLNYCVFPSKHLRPCQASTRTGPSGIQLAITTQFPSSAVAGYRPPPALTLEWIFLIRKERTDRTEVTVHGKCFEVTYYTSTVRIYSFAIQENRLFDVATDYETHLKTNIKHHPQAQRSSCSSMRISPFAKGFNNAMSGGILVSCLQLPWKF